jgi:hypothetical protein
VRLPTAYYSIMAPFSVLSFNWLEAILPTACIGGFPQKLRVQVLAPLVILAAAFVLTGASKGVWARWGGGWAGGWGGGGTTPRLPPPATFEEEKGVPSERTSGQASGRASDLASGRRSGQASGRRSGRGSAPGGDPLSRPRHAWLAGVGACMREGALQTLPIALATLFALCPSASNLIFSSFICVEFGYDDAAAAGLRKRKFLRGDLSIRCDAPTGSDEGAMYQGLVHEALRLVLLWPVGVPVLFASLLFIVRKDIQAKAATPLALALRFRERDPASACPSRTQPR